VNAQDDILSGRVAANMLRRDQEMQDLPASVTVTACMSREEAARMAARMAAERWRHNNPDVRAAVADNVKRVKRMREALGLAEQIRADDVEALANTADQIRKAVC